MKSMKKKGFTLVELLVVIAIIAILAVVSVVGYTAFIKKANESNAMTEAKQVEDAINAELMTGEDFVIATVDKNEDADDAVDGMQYADGNEKITYYVKAEDKKIYKLVATYVAADDKWTYDADGDEEDDITEISAAEDAGTEADPKVTINDAFEANADFAGFTGTFAVSGEGEITYTYKDDAKAVIKFN